MRRSQMTTVSLLAALALAACTNAKDVLEPSAITPPPTSSAQTLPATQGNSAAAVPAPTTAAPTGSGRQQSSRLSDREREVAELLLLGLPYRDIGSQLFISAKTVEHHVARIRRRLGAESRSEMLSMLRAMLATPS